MKTYSVMLPIAGYAVVSVEANSEEEAIQEAMNKVTMDDIEEWEALEKIVGGNVFYGNLNEVEVTLDFED